MITQTQVYFAAFDHKEFCGYAHLINFLNVLDNHWKQSNKLGTEIPHHMPTSLIMSFLYHSYFKTCYFLNHNYFNFLSTITSKLSYI